MISWTCNFFFEVGTRLARILQYIRVRLTTARCRFGDSGGLASGDRATPRNLYENQVSIRSAVAQVATNAKGLKSLVISGSRSAAEQEKTEQKQQLRLVPTLWVRFPSKLPYLFIFSTGFIKSPIISWSST